MPTSTRASTEQLRLHLARRAGASAADLAAALGVSVPTLHRMLPALEARLLKAGQARRTRYALRRPLRGEEQGWLLYAVGADGQAEAAGQLDLLQPQGSLCDLARTAWPVPDEARDGWWSGLPYPLNDMRPQGYLGRQFARRVHPALAVPLNPQEWSDDHAVHVLARAGHDTSGHLILGDSAFAAWQQAKLAPPEPVCPNQRARSYAALADEAVAQGVAGSSAAGEFPKFPALRERTGSATPHVLVKFSGADASPAVQRWSDLLVCEHLALQAAATLPGVQAARSDVVQTAGRTLLEVERFDRHGLHGRSALVSLATLDATWLGDGSRDWPHLAARLAAVGLLDAQAVAAIQHISWFGRLIGNTDMHTGNLSFRPTAQSPAGAAQPQQKGFAPAPVYDMLPMLYAPLPGGEVPARQFTPELPLPAQRAVWNTACTAATAFWLAAAQDSRISAPCRTICAANACLLQQVAERI